MILSRRFSLLALVLCVVVVPASSALARKKSAPAPSVSSLSPLSLHVGDTLTIRGRRFVPGAKHNTVSFKRDGSPAVVVKAGEATRTRLKVVVPAKLAKYLAVSGGTARASRFRVRVGAGRSSSKGYTALNRSPLIGLALSGGEADLDALDETDDGCDTAAVLDGIEDDDGTVAGDMPDAASDTSQCSDDAGEGLGDDGE
jgi:hypothetical protein